MLTYLEFANIAATVDITPSGVKFSPLITADFVVKYGNAIVEIISSPFLHELEKFQSAFWTLQSKIIVYPRVEGGYSPLILEGQDLNLIKINVNVKGLKEEEYRLDTHHLTLISSPSVAKYTCRIEADKSLFPVLLSHGYLINQGNLEGGKHFALGEDPFKKPCYLFALVTGQLESTDGTFTTPSGRKVSLRMWTPAQDLPKTAHAMYSLEAAMKGDEDIFNSKLVLVSPEIASDGDYAAILCVSYVIINPLKLLSLKEGLTIFRDQHVILLLS
ncbi:hypothetical protein ACH5RR_006313 [Cinchona calisaya]|uniref:Uncharacterized protein n=1 Tax=Cinchona calisaya TaxID=153742 RepID=A0ABD3ANM2_9GENT